MCDEADDYDEVIECSREEFIELLTEMICDDVPILVAELDDVIEQALDRFKVEVCQIHGPFIFAFSTRELTDWINERIGEHIERSIGEMVEEGEIEIAGMDEEGDFYYRSLVDGEDE